MTISKFLSLSELEKIRRDWSSLLPDTCSIKHITKVSDNYGGTIDQIITINNIPCMLGNNGNGIESKIADKVRLQGQYILTLPYGTEIYETDKIIIKNVTYQIHDILRDFSNDTAVVCVCSKE